MDLGPAVVGGVIGTLAAILFTQLWEVVRPDHNHIRIVPLIGSAFTSRPLWQHLIGRAFLAVVGVFYGVFTAASIYAFEMEAIGWLFGAFISLLLWILTGVSLTYFRLLHPRIRRGEIRAPGPFGLGYSRQSAVMLLVAHLVFGLVCGAMYGIGA